MIYIGSPAVMRLCTRPTDLSLSQEKHKKIYETKNDKKNSSKYCFPSGKKHRFTARFGWGSKLGTTKCRTTDNSNFLNFEHLKNERWITRFYYIRFLNKILHLLKLFEQSKYRMFYTHKIGNLWNLDSFPKL